MFSKKILLFQFLLVSFFLTNCDNNVTVPPKPGKLPSPTFESMLGVTGGTNWDGWKRDNPITWMKNARSFQLEEINYKREHIPANYTPYPCFAQCSNVNCWDESSFASYKSRYCNWSDDFDTIYASPEVINAWPGDWRGWPNKFWTAEELGGTSIKIFEQAKDYAKSFSATFCPIDTLQPCLVKVFELGNEPWGDPGKEAYHAYQRGLIAGFDEYYNASLLELEKDTLSSPVLKFKGSRLVSAGHGASHNWRLRISTAAFDAYSEKELQNIDNMVPKEIRSYFDFISIHPYSFYEGTHDLTAHPEARNGQYIDFVKRMNNWRDANMFQASINITEIGWNSNEVGEIQQSCYLLRGLLIAARMGVSKYFIYELLDQPNDGLFHSCGLITKEGRKKIAYHDLESFISNYGRYRVCDVVKEDEDYYLYKLCTSIGEEIFVAWVPNNFNNKDPKEVKVFDPTIGENIILSEIPKFFNPLKAENNE